MIRQAEVELTVAVVFCNKTDPDALLNQSDDGIIVGTFSFTAIKNTKVVITNH
jgi:predicted transglutaminase-like protease